MHKPDAARSRIMASIRSTNTKPELVARKILREQGYTGYRVNYKGLPGKPDICFTRWNIAIFINGCYWHRCPYCNPSIPSVNKDFWDNKFAKNIARDKRNRRKIRELGWTVITIWECKLLKDPVRQVKRITEKIDQVRSMF